MRKEMRKAKICKSNIDRKTTEMIKSMTSRMKPKDNILAQMELDKREPGVSLKLDLYGRTGVEEKRTISKELLCLKNIEAALSRPG
jgi:hypothetical protein